MAECCSHELQDHHDDGCENGWAWDGDGVAIRIGCPCQRRGVGW